MMKKIGFKKVKLIQITGETYMYNFINKILDFRFLLGCYNNDDYRIW
jgi:hypothetical protein